MYGKFLQEVSSKPKSEYTTSSSKRKILNPLLHQVVEKLAVSVSSKGYRCRFPYLGIFHKSVHGWLRLIVGRWRDWMILIRYSHSLLNYRGYIGTITQLHTLSTFKGIQLSLKEPDFRLKTLLQRLCILDLSISHVLQVSSWNIFPLN